ncbi:MAG: dienelactone hydrolase family protein [Phycisphaeraceae bacterium]|nr:dienelactone hydrolase family protein [Phycisphaeraceae bacterium]
MGAIDTSRVPGPHAGCEILSSGAPLENARGAVVFLHGRGGEARTMLSLAGPLGLSDFDGLAALAPQAIGNSWYPSSFLAPIEQNRAHLESSHAVISTILDALASRGLDASRVVLAGFSQGACLASHHAATHPRRYGGVCAMTGGLIGPPGTRYELGGSLAGTPVFLGASDPDSHVPWSRIEETARVMESLGAGVRLERYPDTPHTILRDHLRAVRDMLDGAYGDGSGR